MNDHLPRCGCEYGGPCTRSTLCAVTRVRDEFQEEIDRLRAALRKYGVHEYHNHTNPSCESYYGKPCNCGLADELRSWP